MFSALRGLTGNKGSEEDAAVSKKKQTLTVQLQSHLDPAILEQASLVVSFAQEPNWRTSIALFLSFIKRTLDLLQTSVNDLQADDTPAPGSPAFLVNSDTNDDLINPNKVDFALLLRSDLVAVMDASVYSLVGPLVVYVTGLALTKLDGTAKGGIIFALSKKHNIPSVALKIASKTKKSQLKKILL